MVVKSIIAVLILGGLGTGVYLIAGTQVPTTEDIETRVAPAQEQSTAPVAQLSTLPTQEFDAQTEGRTIIDVRTGAEYAEEHLPGATVIDFYAPDFRARLEALPRDDAYALYCRSGNRSGQTLAIMRELGFVNVIDLQGGIVAWQAENRSTCTNC